MRFNKILEVVKLLCKFFYRNVLSIGILKSRFVRIITFLLLIFLVVVISLIVYTFFQDSDSSIKQVSIILDVYSLTVFMWTYVTFLIMKTLFIKKDGILRFTQQLPLTRREKNIALLVFEISITLIAVGIISSSVVVALVARYGFSLGLRIICNVYFVSVVSCLTLELIYALISWFVDMLMIVRMKSVIMICFLSSVFVLIYALGLPELVDKLAYNYMDNGDTSIIIFFTYLMEQYSFFWASFSFLLITTVLCTLIIIIPDNINNSVNLFIKIGKRNKNTMLSSYIFSICRRLDVYNYLFIVIFVYVLAVICKLSKPYYLILILSINGVYGFVQTDSLRLLQIQKEYSALKDYTYLVLSQAIFISLLAVPFIIVSYILGNDLVSSLFLFPMIFLSIIMFTLVGIVFPPIRENPFSVFIGITITVMLFIIIYLTSFILKLNTFGNVLVLLVVTIMAILYSVLGLEKLKEEKRYETK